MEESKVQGKVGLDGEQKENFTEEQLVKAWNSYTVEIKEEHHLKNSMLNCLPQLISKTTFEVVVNNPMQEQKLLEERINILNALRVKLRNNEIEMQVRISENNEKKLAFTPNERFNLMAEENEALMKLKNDFGLELM